MRRSMMEVKTRKEAIKLAPWAAVIRKVTGGYMAWESADEYRTWAKQS